MENSKFQFKGFTILRSLIERTEETASTNLSVGFSPRGTIKEDDAVFQLNLSVKIQDKNEVVNIEVDAKANYEFDKAANLEELDNYFYVNAPALLFPYIRAYISTLTNLSGYAPITLPTLNISGIGEDLKKNTTRE
ncbi:MAG: protein-export chaperone SecB [Bacteroidales bacterium]|nr:protein-export chaperone SecB [Bacteroidales bacterium]MCF8338390.1 protein-export chaperone SecB [Bacteroidales bacterium]